MVRLLVGHRRDRAWHGPAGIRRLTYSASAVKALGPCGGPRSPRKRETCSDRCRAELSCRRRKDVQRIWDEEIRTLLEVALKKLEERTP